MKDRVSDGSVNIVLTSPPYNTGRAFSDERALENYEGRYDIYLDNMTQDEYIEWTLRLFNEFDRVLSKDGVVLYNMSYGSDTSINTESVGLMWLVVADIIRNTAFTVADRIIWKKASALPNNVSKNKLTRIVEDVFVFARKDEIKTFNANKQIKSVRSDNGQKTYINVLNFIEAVNNDGPCPYNKATYSSELCEKLLNIYAVSDTVVYDPFMGTGTTAVACKRLGLDCIGSELSATQVAYANERLGETRQKEIDSGQMSLFGG